MNGDNPNNLTISARVCKQEENDLKRYSNAMGLGHTSLAGIFIKLGLDLFKEYEKALINDGIGDFEEGFKKIHRPRYDYILFQVGISPESRREFINLIISQSQKAAQKNGVKHG